MRKLNLNLGKVFVTGAMTLLLAVAYMAPAALAQSQKRVQRGGSFLCSESYCSGYRVSARLRTPPDTGELHVGFRCVKADN